MARLTNLWLIFNFQKKFILSQHEGCLIQNWGT